MLVVSVFDAEVRPVADAVITHEPGTPVTLKVVAGVLLVPAVIVAGVDAAPLKLQIVMSLAVKVTVVSVVEVVVTPAAFTTVPSSGTFTVSVKVAEEPAVSAGIVAPTPPAL